MNKDWFYAENGDQNGPISEDELVTKFKSLELPLKTLVWQYGMGEWKEADQLENFSILKYTPPPLPDNAEVAADVTEMRFEPATPLPPPLPRTKTKTGIPKFLMEQKPVEASTVDFLGNKSAHNEIRPWSRYWARFIDYSFYLVLGIIFMIVMLAVFGGSQTGYTIGSAIWFAVFLGGWVLIETSLISSIGTTPGKWLFKVKVRNLDGSILSFKQALKRTVHVWFSGTGLGIPLVCLCTHIGSYNKLTSSGITAWDENGGYQVSTKKLGVVRTIIAVTLIFFSYILWQVLAKLGQQ